MQSKRHDSPELEHVADLLRVLVSGCNAKSEGTESGGARPADPGRSDGQTWGANDKTTIPDKAPPAENAPSGGCGLLDSAARRTS